jgi:hypothetical protein
MGMAAYFELDKRFGNDESPGVRTQVTSARLNKKLVIGKQDKGGVANTFS